MTEEPAATLDRAKTAKEVATLCALVLLRAEGDGYRALELCDEIDGMAPSGSLEELDAVPLVRQAIREAMEMRGEDA